MGIVALEKSFDETKLEILANLASYSEPIDTYYEDHVIESKHFVITRDNEKCGYFSVFDHVLLTQFALAEKVMPLAQEIFQEVLALSKAKEIYCSTSDRLLLLMALDSQKEVVVQDYIFQPGDPQPGKKGFGLTKAVETDITGIKNTDDGFFKNLENNIKNDELFIGRYSGDVVSYGIIEKSRLTNDLASIGMFVLENKRGNGYGALTLIDLIKLCQMTGIRPIAGCFVKNQYSVNALKKAGMVSLNRLLKIRV
jgi:hypothetical protein